MNNRSIAIALLFGFLGCSNSTPTPRPAAPDAAVANVDAASTGPTFSISTTPSEFVAGETATLVAAFTNFALVDPRTSPPPKPGEGHYHVFINDDPNYSAIWVPSQPLPTTVDTVPGEYSVRAVLVNSAHQEIRPLVEASTTFTVLAP